MLSISRLRRILKIFFHCSRESYNNNKKRRVGRGGGRNRKNTKTTHRNAQLTDGKGGERGLSSLSHVWRDAVLRESVSVSCVSLASSACVCGRIVLRKISNTLLAGPGALTKKNTHTPFYTLFSALRLDFGLRCDCVLSVRFRACGQGEQKH